VSRRSQAAERRAEAQLECEDLMEPLWKPAPHIRGRHTPPDLIWAMHRDAKRAAFDWLGRRIGVVFEFEDFDALTPLQLRQAAAQLSVATIYTVERDPAFASTPYGAAMIAHWKAKQAAFKAEFGDLVAFRQSQQARLRAQREARSQ
jgi:hypothetical protein